MSSAASARTWTSRYSVTISGWLAVLLAAAAFAFAAYTSASPPLKLTSSSLSRPFNHSQNSSRSSLACSAALRVTKKLHLAFESWPFSFALPCIFHAHFVSYCQLLQVASVCNLGHDLANCCSHATACHGSDRLTACQALLAMHSTFHSWWHCHSCFLTCCALNIAMICICTLSCHRQGRLHSAMSSATDSWLAPVPSSCMSYHLLLCCPKSLVDPVIPRTSFFTCSLYLIFQFPLPLLLCRSKLALLSLELQLRLSYAAAHCCQRCGFCTILVLCREPVMLNQTCLQTNMKCSRKDPIDFSVEQAGLHAT